jgi:hypothetical protein
MFAQSTALIKIDETYVPVHRLLLEHKQVGELDGDETKIIFGSYPIHDSDRYWCFVGFS